jgi:hypothetical protein
MSIAVAEAGEAADVAFGATYGWSGLADLLESDGHRVHMAHPGHTGVLARLHGHGDRAA